MIQRLPLIFAAQARFPAPEFESYTLPKMSLEEFASDSVLWRVLVLCVFLAAGSVFFYKLRSRKAMLAYSLAGLAVFGFLFASCPCPVGMFQNIAEGVAAGSYIQPGVLLLFAIPSAMFWNIPTGHGQDAKRNPNTASPATEYARSARRERSL